MCSVIVVKSELFPRFEYQCGEYRLLAVLSAFRVLRHLTGSFP